MMPVLAGCRDVASRKAATTPPPLSLPDSGHKQPRDHHIQPWLLQRNGDALAERPKTLNWRLCDVPFRL
jgi:hypothetical protein